MIIGHGIDLQEISAIEAAVTRHPRFVDKVLTKAELGYYQRLSAKRKLTFLAGRWAAKEAFSKALGTGIGKSVGFLDIDILMTDKGSPIITRSPFSGKSFVSISHSGNYVQASVILEDN
ncbi:holo-ACP synthase [Streptococcus halichoeri]|uniref:holo-ACP synthase n=1 Tax=Streptococcus halichoeri TaxID=254785 RepID=UPI001359E44F|nr:holo-ACP synthase [Streptococcus halichoeri]